MALRPGVQWYLNNNPPVSGGGRVSIIIITATILATHREEEVEDGTNVNATNIEALRGVQWHPKLHLEA